MRSHATSVLITYALSRNTSSIPCTIHSCHHAFRFLSCIMDSWHHWFLFISCVISSLHRWFLAWFGKWRLVWMRAYLMGTLARQHLRNAATHKGCTMQHTSTLTQDIVYSLHHSFLAMGTHANHHLFLAPPHKTPCIAITRRKRYTSSLAWVPLDCGPVCWYSECFRFEWAS